MPSSSDNDSNKRSPARINVDSTTLSVRQQLALVKRHAAYQQDVQRGSRPKERTSFRRKKDDIPGRRRDTNRNTDVPDGKYNNEVDPIIFIDGYNVIGRWPRLRKWRDRSDLETARRLLIDDVAEFSAVRGWDCVVVYDALGSGRLFKFYFYLAFHRRALISLIWALTSNFVLRVAVHRDG